MRSPFKAMFKVSVVETHNQRRLVLEGKLAPPWTSDLESVLKNAGEGLEGRKLVIDLCEVTLISQEGKDVLSKLMSDGAKFSCADVLTKHLLKQLARRCRCS
jgi:hypothetical protein